MQYISKETGDGKYKISQIDKHLQAMEIDSYYMAQLSGAEGKAINLDKEALILLKRYFQGEDILFRDDYIATTLWSEEDIRGRLMEKGYRGTQDEVDAVLNTGYLKNLGDCTDGDWQMIDDAIDQAALSNEESREEN